MLVKRFLLVAFLATVSMQSMADINSLVADYGVQNARLDEAGLQELLTILESAGSFDTDPNALAASSVLRAQLTADGDTTLAGLGRGESAFNSLFPANHHEAREGFNKLLTSNNSATRADAIEKIRTAMVEPAVVSDADAASAKLRSVGVESIGSLGADAKIATHELKALDNASSTAAERDRANRILSKIASNFAAGNGKTALMSASSDRDMDDLLDYILSVDDSMLNQTTTAPIEFGAPYSALDYARHTGNAIAEAKLLENGAQANVHGSLQGYGPINK